MSTLQELNAKLEALTRKKRKLVKELDDKIWRLGIEIYAAQENERKAVLFPSLRQKADELFSHEENSGCNIVILSGVHGKRDGKSYKTNDTWAEAKVLDLKKDGDRNTRATAIPYSKRNESTLEEIIGMGIFNYVPDIAYYFMDDGYSEGWHGVYAITDDYRVVAFYCRENNYLPEWVPEAETLFDFSENTDEE